LKERTGIKNESEERNERRQEEDVMICIERRKGDKRENE
jgi:hypothetical protein